MVAKNTHARICKPTPITVETGTLANDDAADEEEILPQPHQCTSSCATRTPLFELFGSFPVVPLLKQGISPWIPSDKDE
jgi:hypothetical protein